MRVFVIDDEKPLADTLVLILRSAGYEATAAYDGLAALSQIESFLPRSTSELPHYSFLRAGSYQRVDEERSRRGIRLGTAYQAGPSQRPLGEAIITAPAPRPG